LDELARELDRRNKAEIEVMRAGNDLVKAKYKINSLLRSQVCQVLQRSAEQARELNRS
jgi:hypothetical protein